MPSRSDIRLQDGLRLHQSGDRAKAESIYREIITNDPTHADAWHLLGVVALQRNDPAEALSHIDRAVKFNGRVAFYHNNRGLALRGLQRSEEAMVEYKRALEIDAQYFDAWINLGNGFRDRGEPVHAANAYRRGLELRPGDVAAINNLGTLASDEGRDAEAEALFRQATGLDAGNHESWNNLGHALLGQNRLTEAREALQRGLAISPANPVLLNTLGNVLQRSGDLAGAEDAYRRALAADPQYPDAHGNYGNLLREQGLLDAAARRLQTAISLRPKHADYYNNLGLVFQRAGQLTKALQFFRQAVQLKPSHAEAWNNLGAAASNVGDIRTAIAGHQRAEDVLAGFPTAGSNRLLAMHYSGESPPTEMAALHRTWAERYARPFYPEGRMPVPIVRERRVRVGYLSPDFKTHAVSYFVEPLLRAHDRSRFEVFAYSDVLAPDTRTAALSQLPEHWVKITGANDEELAQRIQNDGIDILVDLAGHTARNRLLVFARAPAPWQVSHLGYPDTTGLETIDFRLTDAQADPPGQTERWHTETLLRLPRCAWCFAPPIDAPAVGPLPALRRRQFTFGSFSNFAKVSAINYSLWSAVLTAAPTARLLLKANPLVDAAVREATWAQFAAHGLARERVELLGWDREENDHLRRYHEIDLALDTFPYHGTTTTCEALWMGVPVQTFAGAVHVSRVGVSLLTAAGLGDFIAGSEAEYVAQAASWAGRLDELARIRAQLRERLEISPLTDTNGYVRAIENSYEGMLSGDRSRRSRGGG